MLLHGGEHTRLRVFTSAPRRRIRRHRPNDIGNAEGAKLRRGRHKQHAGACAPLEQKWRNVLSNDRLWALRPFSSEMAGLARRSFSLTGKRVPLWKQKQAGDQQRGGEADEHAIPTPAFVEKPGNGSAGDRADRPATVD